MTASKPNLILAGSVDEVRARGCAVVTGGGHAIAVFAHGDGFAAVDNRCPHMGFPLDRGTLQGGILTCHWHHARFDLASGGAFDPFSDDVRAFPVTVSDGQVWIDPSPPEPDPVRRWSGRLRDGMEHNLRLVIAKSVLGLAASPADYRAVLAIGADFGTTYSDRGWGQGLTMMTCSANILERLHPEDRPRALYQGVRQVAAECAGRPPRFPVDPLPTSEARPEVLKEWFRKFIEVRDDEGAERCLRTAIDLGASQRQVADMVFAAATDHLYLDGGHVVDFCNKAFELLDHVGWEHAGQVLTSLVHGMASARRSEELNSWRNPIDLSSMVWSAREDLPGLLQEASGPRSRWNDEDDLAAVLLDDRPADAIDALKEAVRDGATAEQLGGAVAYAAFLRTARFHTSNEFGDWDTVHNTLTAANALHQALRRAPSPELLRAVFDTAVSVYLDRFLNMPAQPLPEPPTARRPAPTWPPGYWRRWTPSSRWSRRRGWSQTTWPAPPTRTPCCPCWPTPCSGRTRPSTTSRSSTPPSSSTSSAGARPRLATSWSPWPASWRPTTRPPGPRTRRTKSPSDSNEATKSSASSRNLRRRARWVTVASAGR